MSAAITWIFANHQLVLYAVGGLAIVLIAFSVWGMLRSIMRRGASRSRRRKAERQVDGVAEAVAASDAAADATEDLDLEPFLDDLDAPEPQPAHAAAEDFDIDELDLGEDEPAAPAFAHAAPAPMEQPIYEQAVAAAEPEPEPAEAYDEDADAAPQVAAAPGYNPCRAAPVDAAPTHEAAAAAVPATEDVGELAEAIFEANCPRLQAGALDEARRNVRGFAAMLRETAQAGLTAEARRGFATAEVQLLLHQVVQILARRADDDKSAVLASLLIGRVKHHDKPEIVDLLDQSIDVVCRINNIAQLKIVIMCLYLRSINLRSNQLAELENIVKYATAFGADQSFSNIRTGTLFSHGLLMYNGGMDRIEGQILRAYAPLMDIDPGTLETWPGESREARQIVYDRLNLSEDEAGVLEALGQSQCGRATATGIGWATAAAYIEAHTGQPADWERMVR